MYCEMIKLMEMLVVTAFELLDSCALIIFERIILWFLGDEDAGFALEVGEEGEVLVAECC
jgi:hypothetical protein